jgi:hypothetical protein
MKLKNAFYNRNRRAKFEQLSSNDDLFVPVRGRRGGSYDGNQSPSSPILTEKKAKLEVLMNDLFMPNRGKRQLLRKHIIRLDPYNTPRTYNKRNIELNVKDYFVPNRGKRQRAKIDEILTDNFFPQRGKKSETASIINTPEHIYPPFSIPNEQNMINRFYDLNLGSLPNEEVKKNNFFVNLFRKLFFFLKKKIISQFFARR